MSRWRKNWIYLEIVHLIEIIPLTRKSPAGTSEVFDFGTNWDLRRNCTLYRNCARSDLPWEFSIPGYSFSGIPLFFLWRLRIISFWCQLGSSLELSFWHLGINSVWHQSGSPLGFAITVDSISGIAPCFPPLGFTLLSCSWRTPFSTVGGLLFFSFLGYLHSPSWNYNKKIKITTSTYTRIHPCGDQNSPNNQSGASLWCIRELPYKTLSYFRVGCGFGSIDRFRAKYYSIFWSTAFDKRALFKDLWAHKSIPRNHIG